MDETNGNTGDWNTGNYNTGYCNTGNFNSCDFSAGVFCTTEEKIRIFNMPSDLTASEFYASKYYKALCSAPFILRGSRRYVKRFVSVFLLS